IDPVLAEGARVSSTRIRQALVDGRFDFAARLLGKPYAVSGRVVRGQQLGRTLGYPTANLRFGGKVPALRGIYATRVRGVADVPWPSVSSFGTRPTVGGVEPLLEAHLFDFDGDLYGRRIEVEFVARLRDEEKFPDLPTLVAQMHRDAGEARRILQQDLPGQATACAKTTSATSPRSCCRRRSSPCAGTCPGANRPRSSAGSARTCTRACASTRRAGRCSCCTTARRTPTA